MKKFTFVSAFLFCAVLLSHGQWFYSNLSEPKAQMGAVTLGSKAYFACGGTSSAPWITSMVEIFVDDDCQFPSGFPSSQTQLGLIEVYPNPTSGMITIETLEMPAYGRLYIINFSGTELITQQITESGTQIDITGMPSGVYVVRVMGEKTVQVGKIIKW